METVERFFACPYCWQQISVLVDPSGGSYGFVEDCEVCCQPIQFDVESDGIDVTGFEVRRAQ